MTWNPKRLQRKRHTLRLMTGIPASARRNTEFHSWRPSSVDRKKLETMDSKNTHH